MISKISILLTLALCVLGDEHHAVSEQYIKINHKEHHGPHGELSHIGSKEPEHHEEYAWSYPSYEFSYSVHDPHTHDKKGQKESREGDEVKGEYWLMQPDGRKRTVTYHTDKHSGFNAIVHYSDGDHHAEEHHYGHGKEEHKDEKGDDNEAGQRGDEGQGGDESESSEDSSSEEESGEEGRGGEESRGRERHIETWGYGPKWDHGKHKSRGDEGRDHEESIRLEERRRFDEQRGYKSYNTPYYGHASRINPRFYRQNQHKSARRH